MTLTRMSLRTGSPDGTKHLGAVLGRAAEPGDVLALWGELGSGKTTFVRGIATGLGIPETDVTSPTFVIVHEHGSGRIPLFHVDLYRLDGPESASSTGWEEALSGGGLTAIEWPGRLEDSLPADRLDVRFTHQGGDARRIDILATGPRSERLRRALP